MAPDQRTELFEEGVRLALADLLNRVLDKGVVITGTVTISVADIDLLQLGLNIYLTSVEGHEHMLSDRPGPAATNADLPLLPPDRES